MNQHFSLIKDHTEAEIIEAGLQTFMSVLAERDRLRKENELLQSEVELKRTRIADAERELATLKTNWEIASSKNARLNKLLERFVEFLGGAGAILSEAIADVAPLVPTEQPQTMREAIGADIREHMSAELPRDTEELNKFAEIWGGVAP